MAESALSIGYPELRKAVGYFLGYGQSVSDWSSDTDKSAHVEDAVQSGVRNVYYTAGTDRSVIGYEWSWLRPTTTLSIYASYATGTVTIVSGVVTLDSGTWPSWAAAGELVIDSVEYPVDTRDGDTQITLDDTSLDADAETTYSLVQSDYDFPDDFGRIVGLFNFPTDEHRLSIECVPIGVLLAKRASSRVTSPPLFYATRYKTTTGVTGQRQEVLFYPDSDQDFVLLYEYEAYQFALSDSFPYPLGGMQLAELYKASCISVAERIFNDETGIRTQHFNMLLIDAVARDRKRSARSFGNMGDRETAHYHPFRRGYTGETYPIQYKGESI